MEDAYEKFLKENSLEAKNCYVVLCELITKHPTANTVVANVLYDQELANDCAELLFFDTIKNGIYGDEEDCAKREVEKENGYFRAYTKYGGKSLVVTVEEVDALIRTEDGKNSIGMGGDACGIIYW